MVTLRPLDPAFPVRVEGGGTKLIIMNKVLQKIQKETNIKMGKYDTEKNRIYNMCQASILMLEELWKAIEEAGMQNEQFVLNFLDKINEISIRN